MTTHDITSKIEDPAYLPTNSSIDRRNPDTRVRQCQMLTGQICSWGGSSGTLVPSDEYGLRAEAVIDVDERLLLHQTLHRTAIIATYASIGLDVVTIACIGFTGGACAAGPAELLQTVSASAAIIGASADLLDNYTRPAGPDASSVLMDSFSVGVSGGSRALRNGSVFARDFSRALQPASMKLDLLGLLAYATTWNQ